MSKFWKGDFEMKKDPTREDETTESFLELYELLPRQAQKMAEIVLKIGSSNILTEQEFEYLIQNLMRE